ncbi:ATP-grasp domain-containing protein [Ligilactobacillus animalis]|nr:ATP-grasp domain-containing protein [Ligilactobacillus animalis]
MDKKVIVIETVTTGTGFNLFYQNTELDFYLFTKRPEKYHELKYKQAPPNVTVITVDTTNEEAIKEKIELLGIRPHAIFSLSDGFVEIACRVAYDFGCVANDPELIALCRNKQALRDRLQKMGIKTPEHHLLPAKLTNTYKNYPYIVKPNSGTGSMGVLIAHDFAELEQCHARLKPQYSEILLEEMLLGPLISHEVFVSNGKVLDLGLTSRVLSDFPYFVELGCSFPMDIGPNKAEVFQTSKQILEKLGYQHGPVHIEYILTATGPVLVEINPRLAGGPIGNMLLYCLQENIYHSICQEYLTGKGATEFNLQAEHGMAVVSVFATVEGVLAGLELDLAKKYPGIVKIEILKVIGDKLALAHDYSGEILRVYATGKNSEEAYYRALAAKNAVKIQLK